MRRKRILGLATIGLVFSLALAGCTGSSKESTASKNTEEGYPVTIVHMIKVERNFRKLLKVNLRGLLVQIKLLQK